MAREQVYDEDAFYVLPKSRTEIVEKEFAGSIVAVEQHEEEPVNNMQIKHNVKMLCSRVQTMLRQRRRKQKRVLEISAPFNLQREPASLPGVPDIDIHFLREKAAASCIGIAETMPRSPSATLPQPSRPTMGSILPSSATVPTQMSLARNL